MKLNFGCGKDIRKGYINLDIAKLPGVDKIHNINKFPYPFKDNFFDEIYCSHVLEHVNDLIKTLEELYRIAKPSSRLIIKCPYFSSPGAFSDPTHKRFFTYNTFDYFDKNSSLNYYSKARFKTLKKRIKIVSSKNILIKIITLIPQIIIDIFPAVYQRFFCYIMPCSEIEYTLKVIK